MGIKIDSKYKPVCVAEKKFISSVIDNGPGHSPAKVK